MKDRATWRSALIVFMLAAVLGVYLFVQAPAPLAAGSEDAGELPIRTVLVLLDNENAAARAVWTESIVNAGLAHGFAFDERWREPDVHSGPLPALFLRETARHLERATPELQLFLGSPYPISSANRFTGAQADAFARIAVDAAPQFFVEPTTQLHTAMFADRAVVEACTRCHNEHRESPKKDWKRGDIMGATTWMYPRATVSARRALELLGALRASIRASYTSYLEKAQAFPRPPTIGAAWPSTGNNLPSADVFMREIAQRSSVRTLRGLLEPTSVDAPVPEAAPAPPPPPAPSPPVAPPADVLVIRAKRSTRVTVEYAGVRLVVARLRAGAITTVTSPPPLRVHVDNPDDIALEYRDRPVEGTDDVEIVDDETEAK